MSFKSVALHTNEKPLHVIHHHLAIIVPHLIVCAVILILDFFLMYFLFLQGLWGVALFAAVIVVAVFYVSRLFFLFNKNALVITSERLIDVERTGFFEEFASDYPFSEIKKAEAVRGGIFSRMWHYGNLKLVVEKEPKPFELYKIPNPEHWQKVINEKIGRPAIVKTGVNITVGRVLAEVAKMSEGEKEELKKQLESY